MRGKTRLLAIVLAIGLSACAGATAAPATTVPGPERPTGTVAVRPPPIDDGEHFGFVIVGTSNAGVFIQIDTAEMLTGDAAHEAAVDGGVIDRSEDLPNDFFIDNVDEEWVEVPMVDGAPIRVISAHEAGETFEIGPEALLALFTDTYDGPAVYGIAAGEPIPMDVEIVDGVVVSAAQVYLP